MCIQMEKSITLTFLEDYFIKSTYYADILIEQEVIKQNEMEELLRDLDAYRPQRNGKRKKLKNKFLIMHTNCLKEGKWLSMHLKMTFFHCLKDHNHFKENMKTRTKNLFPKKKDQNIIKLNLVN